MHGAGWLVVRRASWTASRSAATGRADEASGKQICGHLKAQQSWSPRPKGPPEDEGGS